ncbi:CidA/LrgA family protein [Psychrobacillus sp. NPDC058041]|uniref:CidA/LrgA family protein n=1 Tax=Psychrobacillus sp. NPDC058041 TaxID=3346310 RepID=UPI0036DE2A1D
MKRYIRVIIQVGILFIFSLIGTLIVHSLHIKFPGSIVGLILLFISLYFKLIPVSFIKEGAGFLLSILALFFVPATVGVMNYPELLSVHGFLVLIAVMVSTIFTIVVSGRICQYLENKEGSKVEE